MSGNISLGSPLYWSSSVFVHFCIGSEMHWLTSVLSDLYWLISILITSILSHFCTGWPLLAHLYTDTLLSWLYSILAHLCTGSTPCWSFLYWLTSIDSLLCCPTSVMSGLTTDSFLYWLNSVLAHICFGSPPVLADFWTGSYLNWLTTLPPPSVLAHVSCT
jgi:hypothetical protein